VSYQLHNTTCRRSTNYKSNSRLTVPTRRCYISTLCNNRSLRRISTLHTAIRNGSAQKDFTRCLMYSPLNKTVFYPYFTLLRTLSNFINNFTFCLLFMLSPSIIGYYATNRKVSGSIPDGVTGFFH
jgi:hypothetical protein